MTILTELKNYAEQHMELPPEMYGITRIRWLVELNAEGEWEGITRLGGDKGKEKRGKETIAPHISRSSGIKPKLLADTGEYVLGIGRETSPPEKVDERHQQFKTLVKQCAEATGNEHVKAIATFLDRWNPEDNRDRLPQDFDPSTVVTFRVLDLGADSIIPAEGMANQ